MVPKFLLKIANIKLFKADDEDDDDENDNDSEQMQTNQTEDTEQQCFSNQPTKCPSSKDTKVVN